jgi:hypothetical protein
MSSIKRNLIFPPFFYPFDVVLDVDGIMLFDGPFLGQLLLVLTIVLSYQRVRILKFLHAHLAVFSVRVAPWK